jgi:UDP-N-acetylmuramate--alanine ligase
MPADAGGPVVDLTVPTAVHVVGIGGAGMSAVATVLAGMGHAVTGSDLKATPVTERLVAGGIPVAIGHRAGQLGAARLVTASPAVGPDNVELAAARAAGVPVLSRGRVLAAIAATRRSIAVAGTHGKTTTSSMLSLILVEAGLHPSFLIGADVNEIGTNAALDDGEWLVVEADESYGTFQELRPEWALLTNVEPDHLDHYGSVAALHEAFAAFLGAATVGATVSADDAVARDLGERAGATSVGLRDGATYPMSGLTLARSAVSFDLRGPGGASGRLSVPVPGVHNARNAALAAVGALEVGAPFDAVRDALARFAGVPRRFEFRGEARGVTFVDDYAHLPTEVRATLAAARAGGWSRVVAVFQPHRYTRTSALADSFAAAFVDADLVVVTDVYPAGERAIPGVTGRLVADAVAAADPLLPVYYAPGWDELRDRVASLLRPGDVCCTLGAGDLTSLPDLLLADPTW